MAPLRLGLRPQRLPVGDARLVQLDIDVELALQLVDDDGQLQLAHAVDEQLVQLAVHAAADRGVLLVDAVERLGHLVFLALDLRRDGLGQDRLGIVDALDLERVRLDREGVAGVGAAQLDRGPDIARHDRLHFLAVLALERVERAIFSK